MGNCGVAFREFDSAAARISLPGDVGLKAPPAWPLTRSNSERVPIVLMVDQRGLGWVAAVGTQLSMWCVSLQPIRSPPARLVHRQALKNGQAPPQKVGTERDADGDLKQLNDQFGSCHDGHQMKWPRPQGSNRGRW